MSLPLLWCFAPNVAPLLQLNRHAFVMLNVRLDVAFIAGANVWPPLSGRPHIYFPTGCALMMSENIMRDAPALLERFFYALIDICDAIQACADQLERMNDDGLAIGIAP